MSDWALGLLAWLAVAVVASVVIGRFMRMPDLDEEVPSAPENRGFYLLPGYGWEEENIQPQKAESPHAESKQPPHGKYDESG